MGRTCVMSAAAKFTATRFVEANAGASGITPLTAGSFVTTPAAALAALVVSGPKGESQVSSRGALSGRDWRGRRDSSPADAAETANLSARRMATAREAIGTKVKPFEANVDDAHRSRSARFTGGVG